MEERRKPNRPLQSSAVLRGLCVTIICTCAQCVTGENLRYRPGVDVYIQQKLEPRVHLNGVPKESNAVWVLA